MFKLVKPFMIWGLTAFLGISGLYMDMQYLNIAAYIYFVILMLVGVIIAGSIITITKGFTRTDNIFLNEDVIEYAYKSRMATYINGIVFDLFIVSFLGFIIGQGDILTGVVYFIIISLSVATEMRYRKHIRDFNDRINEEETV